MSAMVARSIVLLLLGLLSLSAVAKEPLPSAGATGTGPGQGPLQAGGALTADPMTVDVGIRLFGGTPGTPPVPLEPAATGTPVPSFRTMPPAIPPAAQLAPPPQQVPPAPPPGSDAAPGAVVSRGGGAKGAAPPAEASAPPPPAAARPAGPPPAIVTRYTPNPAVSQAVRGRILGLIAPEQVVARQAIAAGQPWQEFDALLRRYGYSSLDLADVLTAYYVICWEVVTGGDASREIAGIAAVRRGVLGALAGNPNFPRMTEAERQSTAETLAFFTVLAATAHNTFRAQGNAQGMAVLRQQVAGILRNQGVEIGAFRLTQAGFQRG